MEQDFIADLHIHSTASDGMLTPRNVIETAVHYGVKAVAIADHDTIAGIQAAEEAAKSADCDLIAAVELSTTVEGADLHMLGYYFDWTYEPLLERLEHFQKVRAERAERMVQKLNQLGFSITYEQVQEIADSGAIGRPHIAEALVREGIVNTKNEAFNRYIGYTGPAYVPKFKISPFEGIQLIREAGGVPVLAHPGTVKRDELIPRFVAEGLGGLEVIHPDHNETATQHYIHLAQKHDLAMTGGSDFHGPNTNLAAFGKYTIPFSWLPKLRERCGYPG